MSSEALDAVVVGGGPGGSVAALMLAAGGRDVVVFEREPADTLATGAGILLQPNGLAVLHGLGLRDPLERDSVPYRNTAMYDDRGDVVTEVPVPDFGDGLDHALALLRGTLHDILSVALHDAAVEVRHGWAVRSVDAATGAVEVGSDDGPHRDHQVTARSVIGADGIGSQVRRAGDFGARVTASGRRYARMVVDGAIEMPGAESWTALGLFGSARVGAERTYAYASVSAPAVRAALDARDLDRFVELWSGALPVARPILERLGTVDDILVNEVALVRCRRYYDGRAVVVGDAAHAMAPNLGQGANSAFVDAAILVRELLAASSQEEGFRRYDRIRRVRVSAVQRNAELLARAAHVRHEKVRRLRDRVLRIANRPSVAARQFRAVQQVDPASLLRDVRGIVERGS